MDSITIQYIVISALFVAAVFFLIRRTRKSIKGKQTCSKGCGCDFSEQPKKATY
ncbi:FeoB-associated Cys-rich membrane protein [Parapedobacter sp. 2B3]|uniref:FeoB-associated Cys-rich membrane protein n=1 Tax=Parapedobacter sp. 2B3 TaxID=3342381 RepID=UPI0035B6109D